MSIQTHLSAEVDDKKRTTDRYWTGNLRGIWGFIFALYGIFGGHLV